MAVNESDREDLIREATALRRRVELVVPHETESVIAGFRDDERFSIYLGPEPVYHFNSVGQLRRSYYQGRLYRAEGTTLARLTRQRGNGETQLLRHDLTATELVEFLRTMDCRLTGIAEQLQAGTARVLAQVPEQPSLLPTLLQSLQLILKKTSDRLAPAIKG